LQLLRMLAATAVLVAAITSSAIAADVSGAGATFPYPIYAKWAEAYKKQTGITMRYQSVGSGEGIRQIQNKEVTFGASDMPLKAADLDRYGLVQFPTVIGGVVPVVNVEGVKAGDLTLDGPTLARIFLGEIKSWNDAALRKLNPSLNLPSQPIAVVHRSDGSGTTFVFTDYLSKMSADWRSKVGSITAVDWPVGTGARGNEGVAAMVARIKGAIGYVEYTYAKHNQPSDPAAAAEVLRFFNWAYAKGGKMAEELDYVPMPANVVDAVQKLWASDIRDAGGKPIFALSN